MTFNELNCLQILTEFVILGKQNSLITVLGLYFRTEIQLQLTRQERTFFTVQQAVYPVNIESECKQCPLHEVHVCSLANFSMMERKQKSLLSLGFTKKIHYQRNLRNMYETFDSKMDRKFKKLLTSTGP